VPGKFVLQAASAPGSPRVQVVVEAAGGVGGERALDSHSATAAVRAGTSTSSKSRVEVEVVVVGFGGSQGPGSGVTGGGRAVLREELRVVVLHDRAAAAHAVAQPVRNCTCTFTVPCWGVVEVEAERVFLELCTRMRPSLICRMFLVAVSLYFHLLPPGSSRARRGR
jgi:hypothetical protein